MGRNEIKCNSKFMYDQGVGQMRDAESAWEAKKGGIFACWMNLFVWMFPCAPPPFLQLNCCVSMSSRHIQIEPRLQLQLQQQQQPPKNFLAKKSK